MNIDRFHFDNCHSEASDIVNSFDGELVYFSDHAAALQAEREKHAAEVNEKDAEIERLRETATSRGRCIEDMQHTIARRDAAIARLKKDNSGLHEVQDEQRGIITSLRAELATAKARIAELEDNSLESLSTSDHVLVADMQRRLDETRAELATARTEVQRLLNNVHVSVQTMLSDELKNEIGYRNEQDVAIVVTRICDALTTARAEAQHNADAAEALAGLERLGGNYALSFNTVNQKWDVMFWLGLNVWEINQDRPTYLAAVRAAEQAKGDGK